MTLRLTPEILRSAYEFMRVTQPFCRWKMPDGEDIEFHIGRRKEFCGNYEPGETSDHRITIHETNVGFTFSLLETMGHEMIHLRLSPDATHGKAFKRVAKLVCKHHGFDPKRF